MTEWHRKNVVIVVGRHPPFTTAAVNENYFRELSEWNVRRVVTHRGSLNTAIEIASERQNHGMKKMWPDEVGNAEKISPSPPPASRHLPDGAATL